MEVLESLRWLIASLSQSTAIKTLVGRHPKKGIWQIYGMSAIEGAVYPYLVCSFINARNITGAEGSKILVHSNWYVQLYSDSYDYTPLVVPSEDIMLYLGFSQVDGSAELWVQGCIEARPTIGSDNSDGKHTIHVGSEVQVICRAMS